MDSHAPPDRTADGRTDKPMPFAVPQMPLEANWWRHQDALPPTTDPVGTTDANLAWGRRTANPSTGGTGFIGVPLFTMTLLVPADTDIRDRLSPDGSDTIECPAGSGRYYEAVYVDDLGKGFANEHRGVLLLALARPYPLP